MKRRKPFRQPAEIEAELTELAEWVNRRQRRLDKCEQRSATIQVVRNGTEVNLTAEDPEYEYYRKLLADDLAGAVQVGGKWVKRLQKEHRKVSRFLARQKRRLERGQTASK